MMTAANEKSNAKSAAVPWIIGTVICGGYAVIGQSIIDFLQSKAVGGVLNPSTDIEGVVKPIGNEIINVIWIIALGTALGMIVYIGIKYMLSGSQGMAKVKTTLLPWLIGAMLVAGASGITKQVMDIGAGGGSGGGSASSSASNP